MIFGFLTFLLQPQDILRGSDLLSKAKEILKVNFQYNRVWGELLTLLSDEELPGAGVDNGVGGVVSRDDEVVRPAAPVSVTNLQQE